MATEACCLAVELVGSRVESWRIKLVNTVADKASYGGFMLGPWRSARKYAELRTLGMIIQKSGETVIEGLGAAALRQVARAVAWLANKLSNFGLARQPGDIVLSGSLGGATPFAPSGQLSVEMHDQPPNQHSDCVGGAMPFIEVFIAQEQPPTLEQKRAFATEAQQIFSEELGTCPGSLRLAVWHLAPDDTLAVLDLPVVPEEPGVHPAAG